MHSRCSIQSCERARRAHRTGFDRESPIPTAADQLVLGCRLAARDNIHPLQLALEGFDSVTRVSSCTNKKISRDAPAILLQHDLIPLKLPARRKHLHSWLRPGHSGH